MEIRYIKEESLMRWLSAMMDGGRSVYAPVEIAGKAEFKRIGSVDEIARGHVITTQSAKNVVFPRTEKLFSYTKNGAGIELHDYDTAAIPEYVVFGLHPCDAAALVPLKAVFNWGTGDLPFDERRKRLTVISLSCTQSDEYCFCTSVDGGPGDTKGSDVLLTPAAGGYLAEAATEKGAKLMDAHSALFEDVPAGLSKEENLADVPARFGAEEVTRKLSAIFDSPVWRKQSERCLGCGACAFVCPVCSCFDIQENASMNGGNRLRCWDSCGFGLFTLHTSGHNPRSVQSQRWRQRVMHKFSYMPERLSVTGCTGCGRCSRACPADMNLAGHLAEIAAM